MYIYIWNGPELGTVYLKKSILLQPNTQLYGKKQKKWIEMKKEREIKRKKIRLWMRQRKRRYKEKKLILESANVTLPCSL